MALYTDLYTVKKRTVEAESKQYVTDNYDTSAINNSISNILLTKKGSLPAKPTFGSELHKVLFNQLDHITVSILERSISDALEEWEPRIIITDLSIQEIPEYNRLIANITYEYRDKGIDLASKTSIQLPR